MLNYMLDIYNYTHKYTNYIEEAKIKTNQLK